MTDHYPMPSLGYQEGRLDVLNTDALDNHSTSSYETGESSISGGRQHVTPSMAARRAEKTPSNTGIDNIHLDWNNARPSGAPLQNRDFREDERARRKNRHRSAGGFLLQDSVAKGGDNIRPQRQRNTPQAKTTTIPRTPETVSSTRSTGNRNTGLKVSHDGSSYHEAARYSQDSTSADKTDGTAERASVSPSSKQPGPTGLDVDSTQIVHMALNLSESRRIASRRNFSHTTPPRLAPLPDSSTGSNLRQHFQQQRKSSRTMSPKPRHSSLPRVSSGAKTSSPLQPAFDAGFDGQYRYYFTSSTLARAQRAKEHLELMAQYRRLLETLPPLKPKFDRSTAASPPSSPVAMTKPPRFGGFDGTSTLGRKYNPLQYIRNRKVRARERKVIDGEKQGFGDTMCVRSWVDQVYQRSAFTDTITGGVEWTMPDFPIISEQNKPTSPGDNSKSAVKARRPRVDWFVEPCDMFADAYWLEQNNHKQLIEDREWRKIFPPENDIPRPISKQADDDSTPFQFENSELDNIPTEKKDFQLTKVDTDMSHSSAKQRAKQKLHSIKSFPHRHTGSIHAHDIRWLKKDSASEHSESENDTKHDSKKDGRHGRSGTITSDANDLLQKQMLEMIAKEAQDNEAKNSLDTENERWGPMNILTPERHPASRIHSRHGSVPDGADQGRKVGLETLRQSSPPRYGRGQFISGAQANQQPGTFGKKNASLPTSPELRASRGTTLEPPVGLTLSPPWSRSGSPTRNPLSKLKNIVRDKGTEADANRMREGGDFYGDVTPASQEVLTPSDTGSLPTKVRSSLERKAKQDPTQDAQLGHRRSESARQQPEDATRLRGMFKNPRIDTVLRGGVSKIGDMLWKKDGSSESQPEIESTDESDNDGARGRRRPSFSISRRGSKRHQRGSRQSSRHFLDTMPQFNHATIAPRRTESRDKKGWATSEYSSGRARQPLPYDLLKPPPQIHARGSSSSVSPPAVRKPQHYDSDVSEADSWRDNGLEVSRSNNIHHTSISLNASSLFPQRDRERSRQWSIADCGNLSEGPRLSRRDIARMKTLILSSGIKAMEVNRRAYEAQRPFAIDGQADYDGTTRTALAGIAWADIAQLTGQHEQLRDHRVAFHELYPFAARSLAVAIQSSGQRWQASADHFTTRTSPNLQKRIGGVRSRIADDLADLARKATDEADETSKDLALDQPLKVKHVVDIIEKMLRKRRRRFRWARRGLWLTVEWALVGFMWYVWFVVMILRVFFGVGKGLLKGVRWLLWL